MVDPTGPPSVEPSATLAVAGGVDYPVGSELRDQVGMSAIVSLDQRTFDEYQRRISSCMRARGFAYVPLGYPSLSDRDMYRKLNPLNPESARQLGYHMPSVPAVTEANVHSAAFDQAVNGSETSPESGCALPSFRKVHDLVDPAFHQVNAVLGAFDQAVQGFFAMDEGIGLQHAWVSCMAQNGFRYDSPGQAANHYRGSPAVTSEELRVRAADFNCDVKVGMTAQRSAWEQAKATEWKDKHASELSSLLAVLDATGKQLARLEAETVAG